VADGVSAWSLVAEHPRAGGTPDTDIVEAGQTLATTLAVTVVATRDGERWLDAAVVGASPVLFVREGNAETLLGAETSDGAFASHKTRHSHLDPRTSRPWGCRSRKATRLSSHLTGGSRFRGQMRRASSPFDRCAGR
jgi:hypothetical protein